MRVTNDNAQQMTEQAAWTAADYLRAAEKAVNDSTMFHAAPLAVKAQIVAALMQASAQDFQSAATLVASQNIEGALEMIQSALQNIAESR